MSPALSIAGNESKEERMGARQKLNSAYVNGSLAAGVIAGVLTQSWTIFMVVSAIGLTLNMIGGEIRPRNHRR